MKKNFYKSKTFWFGALTFVGSFVPSVQAYMAENAQQVAMVWSSVALLLRLVTKDKITLTE